MSRKFPAENYVIEGRILNTIWRDVYLPLIEDDGTPAKAIKGDRRRDLAQRLGALLEGNAVPDEDALR
jgi:hypothetical protein